MATTILIGDCRERLKELPDASVHCCVTSPPYFGLRDYGHEGQMGLEPTPDEFVAGMVEVFREVRRVLRDDGTLWLNIGDSYSREGGRVSNQSRHWDGRESDPGAMHSTRHAKDIGLKPKDLIGIPWLLAFALRADGWYLRQDIIWHKPNPMPESVRDRCVKAHEYIFLLSKSRRYYYNAEAIKENAVSDHPSGNGFKREARLTYQNSFGEARENPMQWQVSDKRNKRSVWTVNTKPYKGAHFATFPTALIEPCILAGCPEGGMVLDPFGGAGTTALVSRQLGRNCTLIELNPAYAAMAEDRLMPAVDSSDW